MKEIELTQGKVALVDDEDYDWLNKWKWYTANRRRNLFYAQRGQWNGGRVLIIGMHRLILNAPKGVDVDHRDTNGLNNQRYNIRLCTKQQNNMNRRPQPNTSSQFKGVCWDKEYKKWCAQIQFNQKNKKLGRFISETEAALAYNKAATKLFGDFARINIIGR